MISCSTPVLADFSTLLTVNIEQQPPLEIANVLAPYKMHFSSEYEWMNGCIQTYGKLSCDEPAIYAGILTLISAISGSTFYVDECNGQERPINLYVHVIGEPAPPPVCRHECELSFEDFPYEICSGKSTPVNYIKVAMCQLIDLFPDLYNKKININDKIIKMASDVIPDIHDNTSNNTQSGIASKTKSNSNDCSKKKLVEERMKMIIGDLFAITDELDSQFVRLGVFKSNDDTAAPGSKLLTQAYDGIHHESRGTGTSKHVVDNAKLAIFGASTGNRYTFNMRSFAQNIGNDDVLVRMSYLVISHGIPKSVCNRLPISMPNALHIATVISLLVNCGYPVQLRFEKLQSDLDNEPPEMLPLYQRERRSFIDGEALPISYELVPSTNTRNKRRTIDVEEDGSTLSAYALLEKLIKEDLAKSEDMNRAPHVRALYAKTTKKVPRIVANTHLFFIAIHLLTSNDYELFNYVSFREGSGTANSINGLSSKFLETAKNVVYNYMKMHFKIEKIKVGDVEVVQGKFIIDVTKEAILAGYNLYKYMQDIQFAVFDLSGLDGIVKKRLANSSRKVEEVRKELTLRNRVLRSTSMIQPQESDTVLIFKLPSSILKRVWITNKKDAPSWAGIFSQSSKKSPNSKTTERGTKAIDTLLECGLIKQCNYLPKNSGLWKASPAEILLSESLQIDLYEHVGINVNH
ncbi:unnamed protein product [Rotaria sp. Silwood1]|nr:unnamed protein product [Rotaria sp. Silwood1]CAF4874457.1 unnamed protein product [Rotaria sp. Silwood1]CAF4874467.1 unnamed protein product [Rotaria sp. Silwood1]